MDAPIRILILENIAADAEMNIREMKKRGLSFDARVTRAKDEFVKALDDYGPDVILADYNLPDINGIEALRLVRERNITAPVIIVTGSLDEETAAETIKAGATDYVLKERLVRLTPAIRAALQKKNITEEKENAQKALREAYGDLEKKVEQRTAQLAGSEKRIREILDHIPDAVVVYDRDLTMVYANTAVERNTGRPASSYIGKKDEDMWPPEIVGIWKSTLMEAVNTGQVRSIETTVPLGKDVRVFNIMCVPVLDEKGTTREVVSISHDLTERKRSEDTLRRNEYELRTLVDNSPDIVLRFDRSMRYTYVNPTFERITGITREQFLGRTNEELGMAASQTAFWNDSVKKALMSGHEGSIEFDMSGFFGMRYFQGRIVPEFAKNGTVETVMVIARDVTERKHAEERIRFISFHDQTTGLFNRSFFEEEIRRIDAERNLPIGIILGDVNNLKLANDVLGRMEGDNLLKAIADAFRNACRKSDIVARWGGDEFAVILPKTDLATADGTCARIIRGVREIKGTVLQPNIAIGTAVKERQDQNIYRIIRHAEEIMYNDKIGKARENKKAILASLEARARERKADITAHRERSRELSLRFGGYLNLNDDQKNGLLMLIDLHDIGIAAVSRDIFMKAGRLTRQEWDEMAKHPGADYLIAKSFPDTSHISEEVFSHAERWDGTGYPRGLKGNSIPYLSRVFSLIDVYDVMTHSRPYSPVMTREQALQEIQNQAGKQFDPELARAFITLLSQTPVPAENSVL